MGLKEEVYPLNSTLIIKTFDTQYSMSGRLIMRPEANYQQEDT